MDLASLPPSRPASVALEVCNPSQWRNRRRISRRSLAFDCEPDAWASVISKSVFLLTASGKFSKQIFKESFRLVTKERGQPCPRNLIFRLTADKLSAAPFGFSASQAKMQL